MKRFFYSIKKLFIPVCPNDSANNLEEWFKLDHICRLQPRASAMPDMSQANASDAKPDASLFFSGAYPYKEKRKVFFATSSGLCNLKCSYCITGRPSINNNLAVDDFAFIFDHFGENIYFVFSGIGDFFCGYPKKDYLLRFLLKHDVNIYLDINGVDIKELGDTDLEGKEKIDMINVSYHFGAMKRQGLLKQWVSSIRQIQDGNYNYDIKVVASPNEKDILEEAITFYAHEVQPFTRQKLILVPDGMVDLKPQLPELNRIAGAHPEAVMFFGRQSVYRGDCLSERLSLPCAAGSRYFRIFNNGDIIPCELFANNIQSKLGNVKKRDVMTFRRDVFCSYSKLCDCSWAGNPRTGLLNERGNPYYWRKMG